MFTTRRQIRPVVTLLLVSTLLLGVVSVVVDTAEPAEAAPVAMNASEGDFLRLLNQERVNAGLAPLVHDAGLANTSRVWSGTMALLNTLKHDPALRSIIALLEPAWQSYGENVGFGGSVRWLHDAFLASPGHRANAMSAKFNRVGIGTVQSGSSIWVTVRFLAGPAISGPTGLGGCSAPAAVAADVNGDGADELVVNAPGTACDGIHYRSSTGAFRTSRISVNGTYEPLGGDFQGTGKDSVLWYAPGPAADYLWSWSGTSRTSKPAPVNGIYQARVGDFDGDGRDDILWYAPGPAADYIWYGTATAGRFDSRPLTVNGHYQAVVTDLDGDGRDDVLWYGRGTAPDYVHYSIGRGRHTSIRVTINGIYRPVAGDFDGDGRGDVLWYAPGTAADYIWYGHGRRGSYQSVVTSITGTYTPVTGDFDGDGRADVAWQKDTVNGSPIWYGARTRGSFRQDTIRSS